MSHGLTGRTTVAGVIGWPVKHSLSPPMHNAAFAALDLDWVYVPFEVAPDAVGAAISGMRALGIRGLNVTIPHKAAAAEAVDELDDASAALAAVNTLHCVDGRLLGYNTDGPGFVRSLREAGYSATGKKVALIGAGGSARAVAYAMAGESADCISVINRSIERAVAVADLIRDRATYPRIEAVDLASPDAEARVAEADIVIDSTSVGMHPKVDVEPVVPAQWLHADQVVCDLTYNPRQTTLLRAAQARGAQTVDGTGMLVHQGAIAFEIWTGRDAPVDIMRQTLLSVLNVREGMQADEAK